MVVLARGCVSRVRNGDLLHHSDQGSQYTSDLIKRLLAAHYIGVSMSGGQLLRQ